MKKIIAAAVFLLAFITANENLCGERLENVENLEKVEVKEKSEAAARVSIQTTGKVRFHVFRLSDPSRLVVEMVDTLHEWDEKEKDISGSIIKKIRSGQYKYEPVITSRVVLDMDVEDYIHNEVSTENEITIFVSLDEEELAELEKDKPEEEKKRLRLEPNTPTQEHESKIEELRREREERERELRRRREEKARLEKQLDEMREKDVVPGEVTSDLSRERVNFNFKEADIREILRAFEQELGRNIVPTSEVKGEVTLRLRDVPFDEALGLLLGRMNLAAVQSSPNIIEIMPREKVPTERKTFYLKYRDADSMRETLDSLLTSSEKENATIAFDEGSNSLIVSAPAYILKRIGLIVERLDIKETQIRIKARLIEVMSDDGVETGVSWAASSDFETEEETKRRALLSPADYSFDEDGNVVHEDTIARYSSGLTMDISTVLDDVNLYGLLNFLANQTSARTLSEPTIMTQNKKPANIHVGTDLPVKTVQRTQEGIVENVEFVQEGVQLEVTPVVSPDSDQIMLDVKVSVSELLGFQADLPMIGDRAANTLITIEDGKTVVIGGLIKESESAQETGIPILKDIPILGYLFSRRTTGKDRSELLIFLTPELVLE
ncbi:MAG: secretin N-terminal domain-containing protein [Elusimicrobiota bacterium]